QRHQCSRLGRRAALAEGTVRVQRLGIPAMDALVAPGADTGNDHQVQAARIVGGVAFGKLQGAMHATGLVAVHAARDQRHGSAILPVPAAQRTQGIGVGTVVQPAIPHDVETVAQVLDRDEDFIGVAAPALLAGTPGGDLRIPPGDAGRADRIERGQHEPDSPGHEKLPWNVSHGRAPPCLPTGRPAACGRRPQYSHSRTCSQPASWAASMASNTGIDRKYGKASRTVFQTPARSTVTCCGERQPARRGRKRGTRAWYASNGVPNDMRSIRSSSPTIQRNTAQAARARTRPTVMLPVCRPIPRTARMEKTYSGLRQTE